MRVETLHRVDGVGRQVPPHSDRPFDPRSFERAIHGLQRIVMDVGRLDHRIDPRTDDLDDYRPNHERDTQDGRKVIHLAEDSMLYDVIRLLPRKWDTSVLDDLKVETGFAVRTSVDCGGGILVYATFFVQDGMFRKLNVGHTCLEDPDETIEVTDLSSRESSRVLTHLNRYLEREVTKGYARTLQSAATAFDFIATKEDTPPGGSRQPRARDLRERSHQKDWASVRGKTPQTVSDNVRAARKELRDLPESASFKRRGPALEELDPDAEATGDIRLV